MKSNELRIGNLVFFENKAVIVAAINSEDGNELDMYSPIPLTEEWLLKFGFKLREQGVCNYYYIGINDITRDWLFDIVWLKDIITLKVEGFPFYKNGRHEIKSVHQLQNLYFALTKEELTMK